MAHLRGSCHCGTVTFEFSNPVTGVLECNCSICSQKGALWHATDDDHFTILSGKDNLHLYQFGTKTAKHYFCKSCGISTFSNPRLAPDKWVVNLRCVDGVDLTKLTTHQFDGKNWEQAARQFLKTASAGAV